MRDWVRNVVTVFTAALVVSGCARSEQSELDRALRNVNVIDESNMNDIMLTVADPNEAVAYFRRAIAEDPERLDLHRGLASSLVRAKRASEAVIAWSDVTTFSDATNDDRIGYADALVRDSKWDEAEAILDTVPPTHETYKRYRLEAIIADGNQEWGKADSFYETAVGLTTQTASIYNNWGFSKLSRGQFEAAESLFQKSIASNPDLFTAKNNLVLARSAQRNYTLPMVQATQVERAKLLHTMALAAIKQGDVQVGKNLLQDAIDTHPQHFEQAIRSLSALGT